MSNTLMAFVAFLHEKFRSTEGPSKWYGGHDIDWSGDLIYEATPDTEGYGSSYVDFTLLLDRIDEFAAEFKAKRDGDLMG
jgi:hypothetical protein